MARRLRKLNLDRMRKYREGEVPDFASIEIDAFTDEALEKYKVFERKFRAAMQRKHGGEGGEVHITYRTNPETMGRVYTLRYVAPRLPFYAK